MTNLQTENLHAKGALLYGGAPLAEAKGAVILLHGRGASADDILGLGDVLRLPDVAFVAPQAYSSRWYPESFLAPREQNEPWLTWSLERVAGIVSALEQAGIPAEKIAIGGFSQGACLATEFAATFPKRYAAILAFTGGLIGPPGSNLKHSGSLDGTPVFLANGDSDPFIPWQRTLETARELTGMGAEVAVQQYPGRPHMITQDEISHAEQVLKTAFSL